MQTNKSVPGQYLPVSQDSKVKTKCLILHNTGKSYELYDWHYLYICCKRSDLSTSTYSETTYISENVQLMC